MVGQSVDLNVGRVEISQDVNGKKEALLAPRHESRKTFSLSLSQSFKDRFSCLVVISYFHSLRHFHLRSRYRCVYIYIYLDKIPLLFSFLFVRYNDFDRDKFDKFSAFLFDRWIY